MGARMLPPIIGASVMDLTFEQRVHWYAIWIMAFPHQTIHFKHPYLNNGFLSEAHGPL